MQLADAWPVNRCDLIAAGNPAMELEARDPDMLRADGVRRFATRPPLWSQMVMLCAGLHRTLHILDPRTVEHLQMTNRGQGPRTVILAAGLG